MFCSLSAGARLTDQSDCTILHNEPTLQFPLMHESAPHRQLAPEQVNLCASGSAADTAFWRAESAGRMHVNWQYTPLRLTVRVAVVYVGFVVTAGVWTSASSASQVLFAE